MAEYVHSGEKIQASQYNALVDAIAGPTNATADQPFTQTKNGIVINGGLGRQTTKAASTVPAMFEVSYGNGYVGAGYSTYQQGDIDANRFNGVFLNIGSWDTLAYNGFVLGNGVAMPTIPVFAIIDPTSNNAAVVPYTQSLANTIVKGKLPLCTSDKDAGYAFVQVVDNGTAGKDRNGDFVLLVGDFTKIGGQSGSDIKTVGRHQIRAAIRGINIYENCEDVRVVQGGVLWRHNVIAGLVGSNIPHLSYTVGTQYVDMLPDSYVNSDGEPEQQVWTNALMDVKLKSIGIVPREQMGFAELQNTNTFELYNFDKLSSDISSLDEIEEGELSSYDVLVKHKKPHPKTEDDPIYEGQAEADLQYISLSTIASGNLTGDSQLPDLKLSSVVVRSDNGRSFIELHEFHKKNTKRVSDISSDNVDLLIRNPKDNKRELQYLSLSSLSAALSSSSSVDSETNLQLSSIQHNEDNGSLELFDFDDSSTRDFGELSGSGNYDLVLRKYSSGRELPAEVDYLQLSTMTNALDVKTDTTKTNQQYRSLEEHTQDGKRYFGLYDFQTPGANRTLNVKLNYGATTYVVQNGSNSGAPDSKVQFITRDANGNPFVSYDNITVTAPRISTSDVDGIESIISGNVTVISTELSVLSGDLSALSSQLSNYWKVKGTYNNNCYGKSIGDSNKLLTISLDGRCLYGLGTGLAVDWDDRIAYDNNGHRAINWSDTGVDAKCLIHRQGTPAVDWQNMNLMGRLNGTTVAWEDRQLKGGWSVVAGTNPGGAASLTVNGQLATTGTLKIGNTTINETQLKQLLALLQAVPNALQGV